jgi:hypothetical protein
MLHSQGLTIEDCQSFGIPAVVQDRRSFKNCFRDANPLG